VLERYHPELRNEPLTWYGSTITLKSLRGQPLDLIWIGHTIKEVWGTQVDTYLVVVGAHFEALGKNIPPTKLNKVIQYEISSPAVQASSSHAWVHKRMGAPKREIDCYTLPFSLFRTGWAYSLSSVVLVAPSVLPCIFSILTLLLERCNLIHIAHCCVRTLAVIGSSTCPLTHFIRRAGS